MIPNYLVTLLAYIVTFICICSPVIVCTMRRRVVVMMWMFDPRQVEHQVAGHHVGLEFGRHSPPPLVVLHQSLATVPRLHPRPVARRVARRVTVAIRVARWRWRSQSDVNYSLFVNLMAWCIPIIFYYSCLVISPRPYLISLVSTSLLY